MTIEEKQRRKENFMMWITFLPDKIIEFKQKLPHEISTLLDETPDSLEALETYMLNNYSLEYFQNPQNKDFVDGFVSYVGEVFQKNLPNAKWSINLEDENDVSFALPVLKNEKLGPFSPFQFILPMFHFKENTLIKSTFDAKLRVSLQ
jgi:hypothetical protein